VGQSAAMSLETLGGLATLRGDRSQVSGRWPRRVVGAKGRLPDRHRPLILHPGTGQLPKLAQHPTQGVAAPGHLHSLRAQGRRGDRQRPPRPAPPPPTTLPATPLATAPASPRAQKLRFRTGRLVTAAPSAGNRGSPTPPLPARRTLVLTTVGRHTGQRRRTDATYGAPGDDRVIIASDGGRPRHPSWYLNLLATPHVEVQVGAETDRELGLMLANE
jgi:deazaflavin-dependent oxidoreductase (nitroreductase family)